MPFNNQFNKQKEYTDVSDLYNQILKESNQPVLPPIKSYADTTKLYNDMAEDVLIKGKTAEVKNNWDFNAYLKGLRYRASTNFQEAAKIISSGINEEARREQIESINLQRAPYKKYRAEHPEFKSSFELGEITGDVAVGALAAAFPPTRKLGVGILGSATMGMGFGALTETEKEGERAKHIAFGGLVGGTIGAGFRAIGAGTVKGIEAYKKYKPGIVQKALQIFGNRTAIEKEVAGGVLKDDAAAIERIKKALDLDIILTNVEATKGGPQSTAIYKRAVETVDGQESIFEMLKARDLKHAQTIQEFNALIHSKEVDSTVNKKLVGLAGEINSAIIAKRRIESKPVYKEAFKSEIGPEDINYLNKDPIILPKVNEFETAYNAWKKGTQTKKQGKLVKELEDFNTGEVARPGTFAFYHRIKSSLREEGDAATISPIASETVGSAGIINSSEKIKTVLEKNKRYKEATDIYSELSTEKKILNEGPIGRISLLKGENIESAGDKLFSKRATDHIGDEDFKIVRDTLLANVEKQGPEIYTAALRRNLEKRAKDLTDSVKTGEKPIQHIKTFFDNPNDKERLLEALRPFPDAQKKLFAILDTYPLLRPNQLPTIRQQLLDTGGLKKTISIFNRVMAIIKRVSSFTYAPILADVITTGSWKQEAIRMAEKGFLAEKPGTIGAAHKLAIYLDEVLKSKVSRNVAIQMGLEDESISSFREQEIPVAYRDVQYR